MDQILVKSGKLSSRFFLQCSYEHSTDIKKSIINDKSDAVVHPDLTASFKKLIPHLILLCEQEKENKEIKDLIKGKIEEIPEDGLCSNYDVLEFHISGSGEAEGVSISGSRLLSTNEGLALKTPLMKWYEEEYKYSAEYVEAIENCKEEVLLFLHGKIAEKQEEEEEEEDDNDGVFDMTPVDEAES
jgi:hypothetical protein